MTGEYVPVNTHALFLREQTIGKGASFKAKNALKLPPTMVSPHILKEKIGYSLSDTHQFA